jgi:hypothetical protein
LRSKTAARIRGAPDTFDDLRSVRIVGLGQFDRHGLIGVSWVFVLFGLASPLS